MTKARRFNPTSTADVAEVWKLWTGADPGQVLKLTLDLPERAELPGTVAASRPPEAARNCLRSIEEFS